MRELRRDKGYSYLYTAVETDVTVNREGTPAEDGDFVRSTSVTANFEGKPNLTRVAVTVRYKGVGDVNITTITITTLVSPYI